MNDKYKEEWAILPWDTNIDKKVKMYAISQNLLLFVQIMSGQNNVHIVQRLYNLKEEKSLQQKKPIVLLLS